MALSPTPASVVVETGAERDETSYVDWPAILAGTVISLAISFLLLTFGSALGLSFTSPYQGEGLSAFWFAIVAGLWLLWVQVSACLAGGYLTGRMRRRKFDATEDESDVRDGSHGLVVWALGALVGATVLVSGVSGAVSTAATAVGSAAGGAASTATTAAAAFGARSEGGPNFDILIDRYLRGNGSAESAAPAGSREEVGRILSTLADGEVSADDRTYLAQSLAARTGIDQPTAEARVNDLVSAAQQAEQAARDAAETARKATLIAAFATAASLLIAAVGAYFGATLGGRHRDQGTVVAGWSRR
ncbi:MAG: hypothetical protein INR68_07875 [Methylobacterium mesophilicum]|nr:hypothetical protein [Methylobacterium mesophilicum]